MRCYKCDEIFTSAGRKLPCKTCRIPTLLSENIEVYSVARKAITGAFDGWGGIHYEAITTTMDMLGIDDPEKRREYFFMVVYFLKAYLGAKQESETGGAIGSVSGKQKTTIGK